MRQRFTGAPGPHLSALAAALLFEGCAAVGPDFKRPEVPWLAGWSSGSLGSLTAEKRGMPKAQTEEWWRNFNDPVLDRLVAEVQRVNPDVRTAGMRILEARAQLKIAGSLLYPQQQQVTGNVLRTGEVRSSGHDVSLTSDNGGFGIGEDQSSGRNIALTAFNAGFGFGWEIDFWGKFRRSIEAADAGYFASTAQYDDLQVLMAAQAATFYCVIRTIELWLKIAHENVALQKRSLAITERLFKHGNESELDVHRPRPSTWEPCPPFRNSRAAFARTRTHSACCSPGPRGRCPRSPKARTRSHRLNSGSSSTCRPTCCVAAPTSAQSRCSWRRSRR
jgi:outer membrane protein, multidrug efflux system